MAIYEFKYEKTGADTGDHLQSFASSSGIEFYNNNPAGPLEKTAFGNS